MASVNGLPFLGSGVCSFSVVGHEICIAPERRGKRTKNIKQKGWFVVGDLQKRPSQSLCMDIPVVGHRIATPNSRLQTLHGQ